MGAVIYAAFRRKPRNRPARFPGRIPGRRVIVCAGDSLTAATLSADFISVLGERFPSRQFVNAGINGDTSKGLFKRAEEILACGPDEVTILIGTNEVRISEDATPYIQNIDAFLSKLGTCQVALLSIPPLGEDPRSEMNQRIARWNAALRSVAEKRSVKYLPAFEEISQLLDGPEKPFKLRISLLLSSAIRRYLFRQKFDDIARAHGYTMLGDRIHLSDRSGAIVADLISKWLRELPFEPSGTKTPSGK
jgi:lysophospholipase L1-like esterase